MQRLNRKVILLLDNASVHKIAPGNEPANITVRFLPPNTTSVLQPADAGVIHSFKAQYRKLFVQHQLRLFDDIVENNSENNIGQYNIRHAIYNVANAWNNVTQQTIQNCWRKTGIISVTPTSFDFNVDENIYTHEYTQMSLEMMQASERVEEDANNERIVIQDLINQLGFANPLSADGKW
jgi:hypothetical protein